MGLRTLFLAICTIGSLGAQPVAIRGVTLIDGTGRPPVPDAIVVIEGGKIAQAGPASKVRIPDNAETVNAGGRWLMPGIVDLHVHPRGATAAEYEARLRQYLYFGVTAVRSIGLDDDSIWDLRARQRTGQLLAPRIYSSGKGFSHPGGHPAGLSIQRPNSAAEARAQVRALAAHKPDVLKMWVESKNGTLPKIAPEIRAALMDEAHRQNIPAVAHIFDTSDATELIKLGMREFLHMVRDHESLDPAFVQLVKSKGVSFTPTLCKIEGDFYYRDHPQAAQERWFRRAVGRDGLARLSNPKDAAYIRDDKLADRRAEHERAKRLTKQLHGLGVVIQLGSDSGAFPVADGHGSHVEMRNLAEAGIDPLEVIRIATRNGAERLAKGKREFGTVEPGMAADLILLTADPTADIKNTLSIDRVMLAGQWLDRNRLLPPQTTRLLPHVEQVAPGVSAAGFADKYHSANCGWMVAGNQTILIDLPKGVTADEYLEEVERRSGRKPQALFLTGPADAAMLASFQAAGVALKQDAGDLPLVVIPYTSERRMIWIKNQQVLFAGDVVTNGPRADLTVHRTEDWLAALERLKSLRSSVVVPGHGSWGDTRLIDRQATFLRELRRQVAYGLTMGRPLPDITKELLLPASFYTWMPYDTPRPEDVRHIYTELRASPFRTISSGKPNALVLIGDRYHEPEHLEAGLRPAIEAAGIEPHFTVDVEQLTAGNLAKVQLLIILRDGMIWPEGAQAQYKIWMTPEQEKAVVDYVQGGGAFLNLHNSMGLYPENGPYLNLVGGRYIGHGPLERFRVEVVDRDHPITQGITDWFAADEQHTPPFDEKKVRLLLRNRSDEGLTAAAGWAYEPGKGRLVHLASGHTRDALEHPMYQKLLVNAMRWCLRK